MGREHAVPAQREQPFQGRASVGMIVDEKNAQAVRRGLSAGNERFRGVLIEHRRFHGEQECGAAIEAFAFGYERRAVGLREGFGNCQAETEAAETPLERAFALLKRIKNPFHDFRLDPDAGIAHADRENLRQMIRRRDRDGAAFAGELDRVLEEVPNDLLKFRRIGHDMKVRGLQIDLHSQFLRVRLGGANFDDIRNGLVRIDRFEIQLQLVFFDPGEVEQIVDELAFELDVPPHHREGGIEVRHG